MAWANFFNSWIKFDKWYIQCAFVSNLRNKPSVNFFLYLKVKVSASTKRVYSLFQIH